MPQSEREIFNAARDLPAREREHYLTTACGNDSVLRRRLDALLSTADSVEGLPAPDEVEIREGPGTRIGAYELEEILGEGGFGVVYRAQQLQPVHRPVALKIIKQGMDTRAVIARFESERQALALMDHPHIARVFDGGATATGRPYFVMELVNGQPITVFAREQRLSVRARIELFLQVCRAVNHAHRKGIIHRDLKPSNLLVARDGARAAVKVIDFGIAKATQEPLTAHPDVSRLYRFIGTPAYMSPEQLATGGGNIDTRADLYSLGAVLYELLTGTAPLEARSLAGLDYAALERRVREGSYAAPSRRLRSLSAPEQAAAAAARATTPARLEALLRGDLDTITLKCLAADPAQRYDSAEDLARDLERHLRQEPVQARPATLAYRTGKFVRRHTAAVVATTAACLTLAGVIGFYTHRLATERDRAERAAKRANAISELLSLQLGMTDPYKVFTEQEQRETLATVRRDFADDPAMQVEILGTAARTLYRRGQRMPAEALLQQALKAARELPAATVPWARVLEDLASIRRERGDFTGAIPYLEKAIRMDKSLGGTAGTDTLARAYSELGRNYMALEQVERAVVNFRRTLDLYRSVYGAEHGQVSVALGDLADAEWYLGQVEQAARDCQAASDMFRRAVGPDHPNVAASYTSLGRIRLDLGDTAGAEKLMTDAIALFTRTLGPRNWSTVRAMGLLGAVWRVEGRWDEAEPQLRTALALMTEDKANNPTQIAVIELELAKVLLARPGHAPAAEAFLRSALAKQSRLYPENGWRVASTKSLLAESLLQQERWAEAEPLLLAAQAILPDLAGPRGWETQPNRERLRRLRQSWPKPGPDAR